MPLSRLLLKELDREALSTRKLLQCIPDEKPDWKPHSRSFAINRLGSHVAELPMFIRFIITQDELELTALAANRQVLNSGAEMLALFDKHLSEGRSLIENASDDELMQTWTFRAGERIVFQDTRYDALRSWMMNHQIHHRGQLSVYLRLLDIPIPGMYGPSADDIIAREAKAATKS